MPFIAFLGCDGSGKSAVLDRVTERARDVGLEVVRGHWRPRAIGNRNAEDAAGHAETPHDQEPRGTLSSVIKLGWLWANWWMGWWKHLGRQSKHGLVLFDRYHADILVDPRRYRYGGSPLLARIASRLMPQPDLVFFLDAAPEVLLSRKQEVSLEALEKSRAAYLKLAASHSRFRIIDASRPLDQVVEEVFGKIEEIMTLGEDFE